MAVVGEEVLDLVIPYIHNVDDRNSVSLVSRKSYQTDGITRKRLTIHVLYCPNPASLSKRFPFVDSLTLKGPPLSFVWEFRFNTKITPWIQPLVLDFRCLKELYIRRLVVRDDELEKLLRRHGKDLRSLKISNCKLKLKMTLTGGLSPLRHVSQYCSQLRTLCLKFSDKTYPSDESWLHQLALSSTVLERLHVKNMNTSTAELTLLAKKCCNSLISLKIGECYLSELEDAFRYAVRLEHFRGNILDQERELVRFQFPPNMRSLSLEHWAVSQYSIVQPSFLNNIRKLKLESVRCWCFLFKMCPNLEVLDTEDVCGDSGLQVIGHFCEKLRKLTYNRVVTHVGLIAVAKGCTNFEYLKVRLGDISNEAIKCLGMHLKNLRKFRMHWVKEDGTGDLTLDNGIRAMLMGCSKLERLELSFLRYEGLTDVGLEYIGKYGRNLRFLSLTRIGKSDAGLVKLSKGCPKLRKLKLMCYPFSNEAITSFVFNMPSLRYVWLHGMPSFVRPELKHWEEQFWKRNLQQVT